jgi:hypothetical protein
MTAETDEVLVILKGGTDVHWVHMFEHHPTRGLGSGWTYCGAAGGSIVWGNASNVTCAECLTAPRCRRA